MINFSFEVAATTRGMKEEQMRILGGIIADLMHHGDQQHVVDDARNKVSQICQQFVGYH